MLRYLIIISCLWWGSLVSYAQNIVQYEYRVNGKTATVKDISPSDEDVTITFDVKEELEGLENGLHFLSVRVKDESGKWSVPTIRTFLIQNVPPLPTIVKAEYIIDDGEPVAIEAWVAGTDVTIPFDVKEALAGIDPGLHFLQVRVQDALQNWSVVTVRTFLVNEDKELEKIVKLNYYYYDIAGESVIGDFDEFIEPPATSIETDFRADATLLVDGKQYLLYIWAESESGKLSLVNIQKFIYREATIKLALAGINLSCFGANNGKITATASEGQEPYMYSLDSINFTTGKIFDSLPAGNYTVYVKDSENGFGAETIEITSPASVGLTLSSKIDPTCSNAEEGSITVNVASPEEGITFSIDGENFQASGTFENLEAGTYTITAKKANGCMESTEIELVAPNNAPPVPIIFVDESTEPPTLIVTNIFSGSFQWFKNGEPIAGANQSTLVCPGAGIYTVSITSEAGCTSISEEEICGSPIFIDIEESGCFLTDEGKITVKVSGGEGPPFMYSLDGENFTEDSVFMNLSPGEYTVHVKDSEGNEGTETVNITTPDDIVITIDGTTDASCPSKSDGSIAISATGGDGNFQFSLDGENFQNSPFEGFPAGEYSISAKDGNGCEQTATVTLENIKDDPPTPIVIREGEDYDVEVILTVTNANGYSIQWLNNGDTIPGASEETLPLTEAGNYTVLLKDENGCISESVLDDITMITGVEELLESATKVYPVPTKTWVRVEVPYSKTGDIAAHLMNTQGQLLKTIHLKTDNNVVVAEFEVSTLPDGLYFVLLKGNDFEVIKKIQKVSQ